MKGETVMNDKAKTMVLASFAGDALCPGVHLGMDAIPEAWLKDLKACQEIMDLLGGMD